MKTFKVNFRVQATKSKTSPIQILVSLATKNPEGKYLQIIQQSGLSILPKDWNETKKRLIGSDLNSISINTQLDGIEKYILEELHGLRNMSDSGINKLYDSGDLSNIVYDATRIIRGEMTRQEILDRQFQELSNQAVFPHGKPNVDNNLSAIELLIKNGILPKDFVPNIQTFSELELTPFSKYMTDVINEKIRTKEINGKTPKTYRGIVTHWTEFEEVYHNKVSYKVHELNNALIKEFIVYLQNKPAKRKKFDDEFKGFRLNSLSKLKTLLMMFITELKIEDEIEINVETKKKILKKRTEATDDIALTLEELKHIAHFKFEEEEQKLELCRDVLLLGVLTGGTRISDISRLEDIREVIGDNGKKKYNLRYKTQKTKSDALLELPEYLVAMFKKYKGKFPKVTDAFFNKHIKPAGLRMGLDAKIGIHLTNQQTNKVDTLYKPMYLLINSSTCRRTFCTIMVEKGMDTSLIMDLSKHKGISSFERYVKLNRKQASSHSIVL